jgi:hypothetical protein
MRSHDPYVYPDGSTLLIRGCRASATALEKRGARRNSNRATITHPLRRAEWEIESLESSASYENLISWRLTPFCQNLISLELPPIVQLFLPVGAVPPVGNLTG